MVTSQREKRHLCRQGKNPCYSNTRIKCDEWGGSGYPGLEQRKEIPWENDAKNICSTQQPPWKKPPQELPPRTAGRGSLTPLLLLIADNSRKLRFWSEKGGVGDGALGEGPEGRAQGDGPRQLGRRPKETSYWKVSCMSADCLPKENHHKRRSTKNFLKYYDRARAVTRSVL